MKKKKVSKVSRNSIIFAIGVLIVAFLLIHYRIKSPTSPVSELKTSEETGILVGLSSYLNANGEPREYSYNDWVENNGIRVPLNGQQLVIGTNGTNGVGKYGDFTTDDLEKVNEKFIEDLQAKISTYFVNEGFSLNEENTNLIPSDYFFSTIGFEKGNMKCLSHVARQSDPFGYISCGTIDKNQQKLQNELSNVYQEQIQRNNNAPITFRVDKIIGIFAQGMVSDGGGYQWIAKNINGAWTTIWEGQDYPLCSDMAEYEVPKEFYPGCYNEDTKKEQRTY